MSITLTSSLTLNLLKKKYFNYFKITALLHVLILQSLNIHCLSQCLFALVQFSACFSMGSLWFYLFLLSMILYIVFRFPMGNILHKIMMIKFQGNYVSPARSKMTVRVPGFMISTPKILGSIRCLKKKLSSEYLSKYSQEHFLENHNSIFSLNISGFG